MPAKLDALRASACNSPYGHLLVAQASLNDLTGSGLDDEVVGVDRTGDNRLAQTGAGVDHGLVTPTGERIGGEEGASDFSLDHLLHGDGETHGALVDPVGGAVADGA